MIRFLLNGQWVEEDGFDPNLTILRYLRRMLGEAKALGDISHKILQGPLVGTKEGCGSGDCGACTVLVGEAVPGQQKACYRAINSCITLLGDLHGKHLVTVEGLSQKDGELHPAQQAMVDCHGSQCGFCTPGIVMSLAGLYHDETSMEPEEILDALSGNLCRCTGYRPIIKAAEEMEAYPPVDNALSITGFWQPGEDEGKTLFCDGTTERQGFWPKNEAELKQLIDSYLQARFVAGGTDLNLEITQHYRSFETLIGLGEVAELKLVEETAEHLSIGAAVCYSDLMEALASWLPETEALIRRIGSKQIRNTATLGGNIANASPIGDTPPMLIAMNATIEISGSVATRKVPIKVPMEDFITAYKKTVLGPGEYIRRIIIPKPQAGTRWAFRKVSKRYEDDISAVMAAFRIRVDQGRIEDICLAYGGLAPTPARAKHLEAVLLGEPFEVETLEKHLSVIARDFSPISDVRASSDYRLQVAKNLLLKTFIEYCYPEQAIDIIRQGNA